MTERERDPGARPDRALENVDVAEGVADGRGMPFSAEERTSELAKRSSIRLRAAVDRDRAAAQREAAAARRDRSEAESDRKTETRGRAADDREHAASGRDADASERDHSQAESDQRAVDRTHAADDREHPASGRDADESDRDESQVDADQRTSHRVHAADDRERAALDRQLTAADRGQSQLEADERTSDRGQSADDREHAAADREEADADRIAADRDHEETRAELRIAQLDELTGAFGRGIGMLLLRREIIRARRGNGHLVLAYIDVDGLKQVNDRHGHAAGDALLREVADSVQQHLRPYDTLVRVGGDEFVCALGDCTPAVAEVRFQEIRATLARTEPLASMSVGFAQLRPEDTLEALTQRGDLALYAAKRSR
jgi:diguanylate cyclase (GGDEF)-like protein